jgi:hypothetical protein
MSTSGPYLSVRGPNFNIPHCLDVLRSRGTPSSMDVPVGVAGLVGLGSLWSLVRNRGAVR